MSYLLAPDSFKGSFDAAAVAEALARGVRAGGGEAVTRPVADGGEGTAAILLERLGGGWHAVTASSPLGEPVAARFALLGDGETAALDVASASGLSLVDPERRDAEAASSRGTGELIAAAIAAGATRVLVGAGGSATTDGGAGAIEAIEEAGGMGPAGLIVLCDASASFERAAPVFAPQKGADAAAVERLAARLDALAGGLPRDPRGVPMTGCAGGLSGGLWAAFGADLRPGAEYVLDAVGFDELLGGAAAVIGGEGRVDEQSLGGKVVGEIARRCRAAGVPFHLVAGEDGLDREASERLGAASVEVATTLEQIEAAAERVVRSV